MVPLVHQFQTGSSVLRCIGTTFHLPGKCAPQTVAPLAALNVSLLPISEGAHPGRTSTRNSLLDDPRSHMGADTEDLCSMTTFCITMIEAALNSTVQTDLVLQQAAGDASGVGTWTLPTSGQHWRDDLSVWNRQIVVQSSAFSKMMTCTSEYKNVPEAWEKWVRSGIN